MTMLPDDYKISRLITRKTGNRTAVIRIAAKESETDRDRILSASFHGKTKKWDAEVTGEDGWENSFAGMSSIFIPAKEILSHSYNLNAATEKNNNKLSYAASFGMKEIPDSYVNDYKSLLSTFSELSIRENAGQQIVKKLTGKDSELSVDPVFLLTAEEWEKLAKKPKLKNYILIYKLNTSNLIFDFARKLSKLTGRKIVALNFDVVDQMKTPDIKGVYSASVEEFLGYVKYADYVVTNSFHGTAFSVIFHKDFYVEALQKDFKPNDRVESLLCLTGLDECKVKTLEDCRLNVSRDFNFADDQIRKQYIKTKQYFERVLNEDGSSF